MKEKISAVYQIKNMMTGERYVGSSKDVKKRWREHKKPSMLKNCPNKKLYQDMHTYGLENFLFSILAPVEPEYLRQVEQEFIEMLQPAYNNYNANGRNVERRKAAVKAYEKSEKRKAYLKAYNQTEKRKSSKKAIHHRYNNQLCNYNGETLTLAALSTRFRRASIPHPVIEAKKYLLKYR